MPLFNLIFLGLGWLSVGEIVGFIMRFACFPTQQNLVNRKHPIAVVRYHHAARGFAHLLPFHLQHPPFLSSLSYRLCFVWPRTVIAKKFLITLVPSEIPKGGDRLLVL